jgi:dCTP deaminase
MNHEPWHDWLPGVLSQRQVRELFQRDYLRDALLESIEYSAIDLHLSDEGYELVNGSVKPWGATSYLKEIGAAGLVEKLVPRSDGTYALAAKKTYLFKLRERLHIGYVNAASTIHGQATAKSSVGRVDVLARLIVDGMDSYEEYSPDKAGKGSGDLFLEITPMTFGVLVKAGISLSQLRLFCGRPAEIQGEEVYRALIKGGEKPDGSLSVDLSDVQIGGLGTAAFCADPSELAQETGEHAPIPLWNAGARPEPWKYWRFERADAHKRLRIRGGSFYLLRSKERLALPAGVAVYCRAIDETIGEIRIHYAGFAHPFFGRERKDKDIGTPLIFEVRGHDIDVSLRDGEKLARLVFYRMSEESIEDMSKKSDYSDQSLRLSKFFDKWPEQLQDCGGGRVRPVSGM